MGNPERPCKHRDGHFARKALSAFDIRDLIYGKLTPVREFLLTHVRVKAEFFDSDPKTRLDGLYSLHIPKSRETRKSMTPTEITGYSVGTLGCTMPLGASPERNRRSPEQGFRGL
jgi:hypothetical protein